jgi:hypothetical protein
MVTMASRVTPTVYGISDAIKTVIRKCNFIAVAHVLKENVLGK